MKLTKEYTEKQFKATQKKFIPLGFRILRDGDKIEIFHDDLPTGIDMSALDPEKIIYIIYQLGRVSGREEKVEEMRNILGIGV